MKNEHPVNDAGLAASNTQKETAISAGIPRACCGKCSRKNLLPDTNCSNDAANKTATTGEEERLADYKQPLSQATKTTNYDTPD